MQSIANVNDQEQELVSAEVLRGMTITKEALFEKQKNGVLESLMNSMVRTAQETGANSYSANLNPQFDPTLLSSITDVLKGLGYTVSTEAKTQEGIGAFIQLSINW